ncbi:MAG: hypothetical protein AB7V32_08930 [Candidatus Berkiella sp.]
MSTIGTSTNDRKRHLKTLQEKSFEIAAGDVVGGLIYVMDKPLGIEEGMIGMSIDSPGYRRYLNILVSDLDDKRKKQSSHQNKALQAKYNQLIKDPAFDFASLDEATKNVIIDLFLHHPNIARYLASLEDDEKQRVQAIQHKYLNIDPNEPMHKIMPVPFMENVRKFFSLRMHEITTKHYANEGMGGLLFGEYKQHCGVVDGDHFSAQIKKLMHANQDTAINDVYMVKQDGKLGPFHGTGPGFSKILKTSTGKKLQANFTFPRILSIVLPVYSLAQLGVRRLGYLIKNDPISVNSEAIAETMATKLAANRGCEAQQIETLKGTYEDGSPKVTTLVTWTPGCKDFSSSEKVMGNKSSQDGLLVAQTANGETIKRDKEGNL